MSVLIRGMKLPESCSACRMLEGDTMDGLCHAADMWFDDERFTWYQYAEGDIDTSKPANCPLGYVPPHGRLIDEHAFLLTENNSNAWTLDEFAHLVVAVKSSPTIIEAEVSKCQ